MNQYPDTPVESDLNPTTAPVQPTLQQLLEFTPLADGTLQNGHTNTNFNGNIYGGQLIAQAIAAGSEDIPEAFSANNLQLTFLAPGRAGHPLAFRVLTLLKGQNFIVRQVQCMQRERMVFSAQVSFHRGEVGPDHARAMPSPLPRLS